VLFALDNVQKRYGSLEALKGLTVDVEEGSIGLLGPNGAGKSTLIQTLLGLIELNGGSAEVLGHRVPDESRAIRRSTGYMPEDDCYLPYMTAVEYVSFNGRLSGMPKSEAFRRAHQTLHYVGLGEARYRTLDGFSTGMKQRVKLAQGLVHGPELLFLDEPTSGLDPQGRDEMLDLIGDVRDRGVNIVLSSHLLHEVEEVCDEVLMLNEGELVHYGSIEALKGDDDQRVLEIQTREQNDLFQTILDDHGYEVDREGLKLKLRLEAEDDARDVLKLAVEHDVQIRHFMPGELTLEAAFLGLLDDESPETSRDQSDSTARASR
jgi:ABC-2 type transport system ATP-binding protein